MTPSNTYLTVSLTGTKEVTPNDRQQSTATG